ncbi:MULTISPECIES: hypothetical protein [unclassified Methanosarcina]|nr:MULTISPECIES: hypothetical protein [unclassified Methanosarcina]
MHRTSHATVLAVVIAFLLNEPTMVTLIVGKEAGQVVSPDI